MKFVFKYSTSRYYLSISNEFFLILTSMLLVYPRISAGRRRNSTNETVHAAALFISSKLKRNIRQSCNLSISSCLLMFNDLVGRFKMSGA